MFFAHAVGAAARALSPDRIEKHERRDGIPFAMFLGGITGSIFTWFMHPDSSWVFGLHLWTFGLMFGRVSYALPIVMVVFAIYLMRHPSTVRDNGRIGVGLFLFLVSVAGYFHLFGGQPQPSDAHFEWSLSFAGGVLGWLISVPFAPLTLWGAVPAMVLVSFASLLVMTKTAPNRIG
jgi:S-DNA-T family DNA segregation ATPase FtsK/SpoIIIE